jgi:hypothetical protein
MEVRTGPSHLEGRVPVRLLAAPVSVRTRASIGPRQMVLELSRCVFYIMGRAIVIAVILQSDPSIKMYMGLRAGKQLVRLAAGNGLHFPLSQYYSCIQKRRESNQPLPGRLIKRIKSTINKITTFWSTL